MEGFQVVDIFTTRQLLKTEIALMEKEPRGQKPNRERQSANLSKLHGFFWHGVYYREGQPQVAKEKRPFPSRGSILFNLERKRGE